MKVTFASFGDEVASSRLRATIPQNELGKIGIGKGRDVLVYGKHFLDFDQIKNFKRRVYDITDDHFSHPELGDYYREHCRRADIVTCNSEVMQQRIKDETGRYAQVLHEPYESDELEPSIGPRLFWFGHKSNVCDLNRIENRLKYPLLALSNNGIMPTWTPEVFKNSIASECIVIIPTGKSPAKSENRMVESIRNGKYVCAEYLQSYVPFDQFYPLGDIPSHIDRALTSPRESLERVKAAQNYIREKYSPAAIAREWLGVLNGSIDLRRVTDFSS